MILEIQINGELVVDKYPRQEADIQTGCKEVKRQTSNLRLRWDWVEPTIWTDKMLTALENGVKGGKWFSLIDKIYSKSTLYLAWQKVKKNKGAAGVVDADLASYFDTIPHDKLKVKVRNHISDKNALVLSRQMARAGDI